MPKFFFHLRDETFLEDPDGSELPDLAAALASAKEDVRSLISERVRSGRLVGPAIMFIADETGADLASVSFKEVLSESAPWICE
ncbi:DUF6894 family protein [Rhizobium halophilum]|uniref:DUF6894 family protein n=1 Tax=Rhizobium halophilum TaxID=2846852 RepID=UPI00374D5FF4